MADTLIVFMASYLYLVVVILAVVTVLSADGQDRLRIASLALVALPLALILAKLAGLLIIDPRPFVIEHVQPLVKASTDNGFPSDHALLAMTVAMLVTAYDRKLGALLLLLSTGVAAGRVLALAHHPIDVIGSTTIAALSVVIANGFEPRLKARLEVFLRLREA